MRAVKQFHFLKKQLVHSCFTCTSLYEKGDEIYCCKRSRGPKGMTKDCTMRVTCNTWSYNSLCPQYNWHDNMLFVRVLKR